MAPDAPTPDAADIIPAPPQPVLGDGTLPAGYRSKRCKYCRTFSHSRTPLPLGIFNSWDPLLPWADGKKEKPKGLVCRICYNVFCSVDSSPSVSKTCYLTLFVCYLFHLTSNTTPQIEVFTTQGWAAECTPAKLIGLDKLFEKEPTKLHPFLVPWQLFKVFLICLVFCCNNFDCAVLCTCTLYHVLAPCTCTMYPTHVPTPCTNIRTPHGPPLGTRGRYMGWVHGVGTWYRYMVQVHGTRYRYIVADNGFWCKTISDYIRVNQCAS